MRKNKKGFLAGAMGLLLCVSLVGCGNSSNKENSDREVEFETYNYVYSASSFSEDGTTFKLIATCAGQEDADFEIVGSDFLDEEGAVDETVKLSDSGILTIDQTLMKITLSKAGTYAFCGDLFGSIVVDLGENDSDDININLQGANITSYSTSPIYVKSADQVDISANKNTTNNIYDFRSATDEDLDSAIYSTADLKLKGTGELSVISAYNNGVHTKDDLEVQKLTLYVNCVDNALKGNDSVSIYSGDLTLISLQGDGIKTSNTSLSSKGKQKGSVNIQPDSKNSSTTINIYAACDGIDAAFDVLIDQNAKTGCTIELNIYAYKDYAEAALKALSNEVSAVAMASRNDFNGGFGNPGGGPGSGPEEDGNKNKLDYSAKGIKADNEINIKSGTIFVKAYDDALHTNNDQTIESGVTATGNINISGGEIELFSQDDAIHADGSLTITDGTINITNSYEGLEGKESVIIEGGDISIIASDDGINATAEKAGNIIQISGGKIYIYCTGDGIDSNSSMTISGGQVVVISNSRSNASLDAENGCTISGGQVLAVMLSSGMTSDLNNIKTSGMTKVAQSLSLASGKYLTVTVGSTTTCVVKMPTSMSAYCLYFDTNSATISAATTNSFALDDNGVYWA